MPQEQGTYSSHDQKKSVQLGRPVGPHHPKLATRAKKAQRRRKKGKRGRWLSNEPAPLGGTSGRR